MFDDVLACLQWWLCICSACFVWSVCNSLQPLPRLACSAQHKSIKVPSKDFNGDRKCDTRLVQSTEVMGWITGLVPMRQCRRQTCWVVITAGNRQWWCQSEHMNNNYWWHSRFFYNSMAMSGLTLTKTLHGQWHYWVGHFSPRVHKQAEKTAWPRLERPGQYWL